MAGVPCVNSTCSIDSAVDVNGRLELRARLDALGGLVCGTGADPNAGLRVALHGDPAAVSPATLNVCDSLLGVTTEGKLFGRRPAYELLTINGAKVDFDADGNNTSLSTNTTITNNANCSRLAILKTKLQFNYSVTTDGNVDSFAGIRNGAYRSDGTFTVTAGADSESVSFDIAGFADGDNIMATDLHVCTRTSMFMFTIPASGAITIQSYANRDNDSYNVDGVPPHVDNGFIAFHRLAIFDLAAGNLF